MTYSKKNTENNAECGVEFGFDETALIIFGAGNFNRFSTSNFIVEIATFDPTDNNKVIARENIFFTSRVGNQFNVGVIGNRAFEPVPIDDDQTSNIQQALSFNKTNTVMKQVWSKKLSDDVQDELINLDTIKVDQTEYDAGKVHLGTSTTGNDSYQANISEITNYIAGQRYQILCDVSNTTSATLEINSLGAINIQIGEDGTLVDIPSNTITAGTYAFFTYLSSGVFQYTSNEGNVVASAVESTESILNAGESGSAGMPLRNGVTGVSSNLTVISQLSNSQSKTFGGTSNAYPYIGFGQTFQLTAGNSVDVTVKLWKAGSPPGEAQMKIYNNIGGTLLATSYNTINQSLVTTGSGGSDHTFTFSNSNLNTSDTFLFELVSTGPNNNNAYYLCRDQTGDVYGGGQAYYTQGNGSSAGALSEDAYFIIQQKLVLNEDITKVFKASASVTDTASIIGYSKEIFTLGNPISIDTSGVNSNQSGMTPGAIQYLGDTPGTIQETPGTINIVAGKSISDSNVLINTFG